MNRSIESIQRVKFKEPQTSDLAQAGESSPDLIIMITHEMQNKVILKSKLWIVKNRNGAMGSVDVKFDAKRTLFRDLTEKELAEQAPDFMN